MSLSDLTWGPPTTAAPIATVVADLVALTKPRIVSLLVLTGVAVVAADEASAADFLRRMLAGAWVLVEDGEVYRSPDALYINGEMIRHAWRTAPNMRYLGQFDPGPRTSAATAVPRKAKPVSTPARPRSRSARRARR